VSNICINQKRIKYKLLALTAMAALTVVGGCVYSTYDDKEAAVVEEQMSVWQYLKIYSIYHERLPKSPGSMTPEEMFGRIHDTLHGYRYTDYMEERPGGGIFDPNTEFEDPDTLTSSTVYFYLPEFSDVALDFFQMNLRTLARYRNIIIDVRYNGGGLLNVTDAILGELLPYNTAYIKNRYRQYNDKEHAGETVEDISRTMRNPSLRNKKIAVLMNEGSASASEILAAGLKDGMGAYLVGGQSYGKGIGQVIITRGDGSPQLRITFLEISGMSDRTGQYHRIGIKPDPVPPQTKSDVDAHIPSKKQRELMQLIIEEAVEEIRAEHPNISESAIQKYRKDLTAELERWFREPYYALKQLDPGFAFKDDGGDGDDEDDIDDIDGVDIGGTAKRRRAAIRNSNGMGKIASRIHSVKARWRPMGAVIVDEKDLPNIKPSND